MKSLIEYFLHTSHRQPEKCFLKDVDGAEYSYLEVRELALGFAAVLQKRGVKANDRIMFMLQNNANWCITYLATLMVGAIAVPLDVNLRKSSIELVIKLTKPVLFILASGLEMEIADIETLRLENTSQLEATITETLAEPIYNSTALILFTSGTTGQPKGVKLNQDNLCFTANSIINWSGWQEDDIDIGAMAFSHLFAIAHFHCNFLAGSTLLLFSGMNDMENILDTAIANKATALPASPAALRILADYWPEKLALAGKTIRRVVTNHTTMPQDLVLRLMELLPDTQLYSYYGLTEASRSCVLNYNGHLDKLSTVGKPVNGVQIKIENDGAKSEGEGEIVIKGSNLSKGYWGVDSEEYFKDGWFATGDLGQIDESGFVTILGRVRDQINIDGLKCRPEEVEAVLNSHPEVKESAVIGLADPLTFEKIAAVVIPENSSPKLTLALRKYCKEHLEIYKVPKEVFFLEELPRTRNGKLQRSVVKKIITEMKSEKK